MPTVPLAGVVSLLGAWMTTTTSPSTVQSLGPGPQRRARRRRQDWCLEMRHLVLAPSVTAAGARGLWLVSGRSAWPSWWPAAVPRLEAPGVLLVLGQVRPRRRPALRRARSV